MRSDTSAFTSSESSRSGLVSGGQLSTFRSEGFGLVPVRFMVDKVTLGGAFLRALWFYPVSIIPPHSSVSVSLTRSTKGRTLGTFQKNIFFLGLRGGRGGGGRSCRLKNTSKYICAPPESLCFSCSPFINPYKMGDNPVIGSCLSLTHLKVFIIT